ncbi:MAG: hypothetical protein KIT73_05585 [Burkholderiales bacterium]|nr:hypothetical protein [Burkholderiales bacterium]
MSAAIGSRAVVGTLRPAKRVTVAKIYRIADGVPRLDVIDRLDMRLSQLRSLLQVAADPEAWAHVHGSDEEADYLGVALALAAECTDLARAL